MDSLSYGPLEEVVDDGGYDELVVEAVDMDEAFVGAGDLLEVERSIDIMGECGIAIEVAVELRYVDIGGCGIELHNLGTEYATREVAPVGYEVERGGERRLKLGDGLSYLVQMLVGEYLVYAQVVGTPREVCGRSWLLSGTGRARDGVDADIVGEQSCLGKRQESELDGCGEASGVGQMVGTDDVVAMYLGQAIHEVVVGSDAEVLCEVDNLYMRWYGMLGKECLALAVAEAEEDDVNIVQRQLVGELHIGFAHKSFMHAPYLIACIRLAVSKYNLCFRVVQQEANQLASRISSCS